MDQSRREFLQLSSAAALGLAAYRLPPQYRIAAPTSPPLTDPTFKELAMRALDAAKSAGAEYSDVRISQNRNQAIQAREHRVQSLNDAETFGFGVRVLVKGAWGFAASRDLSSDEMVRVAKQAVAQAQANRAALERPVVLAPVSPTASGTWRGPAEIDPFDVPIEEKVALLLDANAAALKVAGAKFVNSGMFFLREEKTLATSDGTYVVQTIFRSQPQMTVTAVSADFSDFQTRQSNDIQPMGRGYEHVRDAKLVDNATRWATEAVQKLGAKSVDVGRYDLVLHPTHLWLTIHESIAHPTELDRAMGYEANYAGTSFVAPPEKMLGQLKYGPEIMNIQGDRTQPGSLSACGWDDEGVVPDTFLIIKKGIVNDYQTTREQAPWLDWWYKKQGKQTRSHGCSYSQSWEDIQFQRMPNVSLLPGEKEQSFEDLIAATDRGIAIVGEGSFSIDQQRYNAQFGGQLFYELKGGKIVGMLKDVAYQMRTPDFWNSMDLIGGKKSYQLGGAFNDGKGQPSQSNAVSHGCVPSRFRNINVINTGRKA
ncbi:MAG: TldD/PmbA family protein [Gemmatimonadota bacterium]|nr:TldD/PmbA family protein [Gemmatimonadota bacterium]